MKKKIINYRFNDLCSSQRPRALYVYLHKIRTLKYIYIYIYLIEGMKNHHLDHLDYYIEVKAIHHNQ